jgi:dihydroorotate dehydrogenase (fumarate)
VLHLRAAGSGVPVIASLNGSTPGGWTDYARAMQDAGAVAVAVELNIYYLPGDPLIPSHDAEQRYVDILTAVKSVVSVPVAVKLTPFFSSFGDMALRLEKAGADGLVLFNRFMQPDINPDTFTISAPARTPPSLASGGTATCMPSSRRLGPIPLGSLRCPSELRRPADRDGYPFT